MGCGRSVPSGARSWQTRCGVLPSPLLRARACAVHTAVEHLSTCQGASLAADRGRLEVEINRAHEEIEALKVKLKSSEDTVKIKDKVIDDQGQSIRALRQSVADKEREMQEGGEEIRCAAECRGAAALSRGACVMSSLNGDGGRGARPTCRPHV